MSHLEKNNILCPAQHGFRYGRSCETLLPGYVDETSEELERGNQEDTIVLNFEKAFDKVSHTLLVHNIRRYGIGCRLNALIAQLSREQTTGCGGWGRETKRHACGLGSAPGISREPVSLPSVHQ